MSEVAQESTDSQQPARRRWKRKTAAHMLLTQLLYGKYTFLERQEGGVLHIFSVRTFARRLGVDSGVFKKWLGWLEEQGYVESLAYNHRRTACKLRLRRPQNI